MIRLFAILILLNSAFAEEKFVIGTIPSEGLFSSFLAVVGGLIWAEKNHKIPVVHWTKDSCYAQSEPYNGSLNPWEYYFKPVSTLAYEPGDPVHASLCAPDGLTLYFAFCHQRENFFSELRPAANRAINKYIQIQPSILEKVNSFYEANMAGKTTIGIHLRGTDKAGGKRDEASMSERREKDLSRSQKLTQLIFEEAEKAAAETGGEVQFFIATDDESLLELAKQISTRPIIYCDSQRSKDGSALHKSGTKKGGPVVGEEVLIEMLLLSKCVFLSHSLSSVSIAALMFNPTLKNAYVNVPYEHVDRRRGRRGH